MKEPKECEICGKIFIPRNRRQRTCASEECKYLLHRKIQREYEKTHPKRNSDRYKKIKIEEERKPKRHDTIVAKGYAERQIANTLAMVGKVNIEL